MRRVAVEQIRGGEADSPADGIELELHAVLEAERQVNLPVHVGGEAEVIAVVARLKRGVCAPMFLISTVP